MCSVKLPLISRVVSRPFRFQHLIWRNPEIEALKSSSELADGFLLTDSGISFAVGRCGLPRTSTTSSQYQRRTLKTSVSSQLQKSSHSDSANTNDDNTKNNSSNQTDENRKTDVKEGDTLKSITVTKLEGDPSKDTFFTQDVAFGSKENKGLGEAERPVFIPPHEGIVIVPSSESESEDLTPPTNCCFSGCPNCVWIEYVDILSKKFTKDPTIGKERIMKDLDTIDDQNIKAYIMMELRIKNLI